MFAQNSPLSQHFPPTAVAQQRSFSQQVPEQSVFVFGQHSPPTHVSVFWQHLSPHCFCPTAHLQVPLTHCLLASQQFADVRLKQHFVPRLQHNAVAAPATPQVLSPISQHKLRWGDPHLCSLLQQALPH
jgi:hypothetical protein